jgi:glucose/arabinose dehydrogenase
MHQRLLRLPVLLLTVVIATSATARQQPDGWPPPVQSVPDDSPVLSPEAAAKTFFLPPGYRLELVASEPLVQDPVWMDFDADGRLWVVEMRGFMPDNEATGERKPVGRVVVLEDQDDDGAADKRTVFLDGLVLPRSVATLERGALVAEPPNLWLALDEDGDLRADRRRRLRDDFGLADGNPEHNANGLLWGLDNWIYTSEHDGHLRLRDGRWEHRETLARGQWGLSMDDVGRIYRNWNEMPLYVDLFPARYFMRNPFAVRTRGVYELTMPPEEMVVWPVRPTRGVNRGYREATLRDDGTLVTYVSAGTPTVYRGDRLPRELGGDVFVTEPAGNLVHRLVLDEDDSGRIRARNAYDRGEFVASTDERFRPVNLASAPDGTLYIADMYRGVIQHRQYQSEYLQHYIREHGLERPTGFGRIYRVVHATTTRAPAPNLSSRTSAQLVSVLAHPNGWWRDTAQRLIVQRADRSVIEPLESLAARAPDPRTRLHALWTLHGLDAVTETLVTEALDDPAAHVRAAAVRLAEPFLKQPKQALISAVLALMSDASGPVRLQVALSIGELADAERVRMLSEVLIRYGDDPILVDAAISGANGVELDVLNRQRRSERCRDHVDRRHHQAG